MPDAFDLDRFVAVQNPVYQTVLAELRSGRKRSHWMWFVFPQIEGLGFSPMAQRYAIASLAEAEAFLEHPILGPRLRECTAIVNGVEGRSITEIFGRPDDMKFRSCMTLFSHATTDNEAFATALDRYFEGKPDRATEERLEAG